MLFAELYNKLSLDADDSERREDILTSTVFGTLVVGEKWSLLADWLAAARDPNGSRLELPPVSNVRYWFWPRLAEAEPDLLLLFDDVLVIVEAKYLSGKSGHGSTDQAKFDAADQLAREWRSCDPRHCGAYAAELRDAILLGGAKRALVYLVRQPASAKTRRELEDSRTAIGEQAALYCLGWSDLAAILRRQLPTSTGWTVALAELLERRGFTSFGGFPSVKVGNGSSSALAARWRIAGAQSRKRVLSFPSALAETSVESLRRLSLSDSRFDRRSAGWSRILSVEKLRPVCRLARAMRWSDDSGQAGKS